MNELFLRVDKLRTKKGVSYKEIAEICGVSPQNVQRWKSGGTIMPEHLNKLAVYFDVSVDFLMRGIMPPDEHGDSNVKERLEKPIWELTAEERSAAYAVKAYRSSKSKGLAGQFETLMLSLACAFEPDQPEWHAQQVKDILDKLTAKGDNP